MSNKIRSGAIIVSGGFAMFAGICTYAGQERFYREILMPTVRTVMDADRAHVFAVKMAACGLVPRNNYTDPSLLSTKLWNMKFSNPIGLAAGFDKNAEAINGLHKMGFGFVEVGSITPEPQPGNPKPRVFRLVQECAIINRYGFNSHGHDAALQRLNKWRKEKKVSNGFLGVNLGKNKTSPDAVGDYVKGVKTLGETADYLVINISSPNTAGLRAMQGREQLQELVCKVIAARDALNRKPPILIKIAPDLTEKDKEDIAAVISNEKFKVDGLIVSNTTITRPDTLTSPEKGETGGLSGPPLKELSTNTLKDMYKLTQGEIPIIGVGGISNGQDAYEKIRAGASLVQLYTSLTYQGPPVVKKIKQELVLLLKKDGFQSVSEAVGIDSSK